MKHIVLKKGEEITALRGSPWVWRDEIDRVAGDKGESAELAAGEIAEVETSK
jgi:hypothetical protein